MRNRDRRRGSRHTGDKEKEEQAIRKELREGERGRKKKLPLTPPLPRGEGLYSSIHYLKA